MDGASSPENPTPDLLTPAFERATKLLVLRGEIDAEYATPGHHEQFPRYNAAQREVHSFTLTYELSPVVPDEARSLELYFIDDYIDETGQSSGGPILIASLYYDSGYERVMTLRPDSHGNIHSLSWLEVTMTPEDTSKDSDLLSPEQKHAVLHAVATRNVAALAELTRSDESLSSYIVGLLMKLDLNGQSSVGPDELDELMDALVQAESVL